MENSRACAFIICYWRNTFHRLLERSIVVVNRWSQLPPRSALGTRLAHGAATPPGLILNIAQHEPTTDNYPRDPNEVLPSATSTIANMADADYDPEAAAGTLLPFPRALPTHPHRLPWIRRRTNVMGHG
jgi:hypothetical protein